MKRISLKLGSMLLMLCLLVALLPGAAFADDYDRDVYCSFSCRFGVGQYSSHPWQTVDGEEIVGITTGYLPDGIYVDQTGYNEITLCGTPTESGNYDVTVYVSTDDHDYTVDIYIVIESGYDKEEMSASDSLSGKVGTAIGSWSWGTLNGENISDLNVIQGSVPDGLYIPTPGSNCFQICGTPTTAGSGSFTVEVETYDVYYYVEISYNITAAQQEFKVTKSPTSESCKEGDSVTFIATASNYNYVEWLFIKNGTTMSTIGDESNTTFNGTTVITYKNNGMEYLVLRNVQANLDGYSFQARFTNNSKGSILSSSCGLSVQATSQPTPTPSPSPTPAADMKAPTISTQPTAVTQTVGNNAVLSVAASDPNGGTLSYQWYSNTAATSTGASPISGANQSSYTPPQTVGTVYYYCSVTSTKDGKTSAAANTTPIAVTYNSADASPAPSTSPEVSPSASPAAGTTTKSRSSTVTILLVILIILAVACLVCQILYISMRNKGKAVPMVKWDCPECGTRNKAGAHFCSECGAKNPKLRNRNDD